MCKAYNYIGFLLDVQHVSYTLHILFVYGTIILQALHLAGIILASDSIKSICKFTPCVHLELWFIDFGDLLICRYCSSYSAFWHREWRHQVCHIGRDQFSRIMNFSSSGSCDGDTIGMAAKKSGEIGLWSLGRWSTKICSGRCWDMLIFLIQREKCQQDWDKKIWQWANWDSSDLSQEILE